MSIFFPHKYIVWVIPEWDCNDNSKTLQNTLQNKRNSLHIKYDNNFDSNMNLNKLSNLIVKYLQIEFRLNVIFPLKTLISN